MNLSRRLARIESTEPTRPRYTAEQLGAIRKLHSEFDLPTRNNALSQQAWRVGVQLLRAALESGTDTDNDHWTAFRKWCDSHNLESETE